MSMFTLVYINKSYITSLD